MLIFPKKMIIQVKQQIRINNNKGDDFMVLFHAQVHFKTVFNTRCIAVHKAFIESGASVITTNSYALVPFHIGEEKFKKQSRALATIA